MNKREINIIISALEHCRLCSDAHYPLKNTWEIMKIINKFREQLELEKKKMDFDINIFIDYGKWEDQTDQTKDNIIKTLTKEVEALNVHINRLNKESIETNIIVKKTLDSWLKENAERIIKEYVREFKPSKYMEMKFKENEKKIEALEGKVEHLDEKIDVDLDSLYDLVKKYNKDSEKRIEDLEEYSRKNFNKIGMCLTKIEALEEKIDGNYNYLMDYINEQKEKIEALEKKMKNIENKINSEFFSIH